MGATRKNTDVTQGIARCTNVGWSGAVKSLLSDKLAVDLEK